MITADILKVQKLWTDLAKKQALLHGLSAELVLAMIVTESSGDPHATRYEPGFKYVWHPRECADRLQIPYEEELKHQMMSWGLMQCMGAVAREFFYKDKLEGLMEPELGLFYACKKLQWCFRRWDTEEECIAAYNAGTPRMTTGGMYVNQRYVDKVFRNLRALRTLA